MYEIMLFGAVLWQQGSRPCLQPLEDDRFVFLYNGDLFQEREDSVDNSDTRWFFERIKQLNSSGEEFSIALGNFVGGQLQGPFSFILLDKEYRKLYFARDSMGRNSLLFSVDNELGVAVSSVADKAFPMKFTELPPHGLYWIDLVQGADARPNLIPWMERNEIDTALSLKIATERIRIPWVENPQPKYLFNFHDLLKEYYKNDSKQQLYERCLSKPVVSDLCNELIARLSKSVSDRVKATPAYCKNCLSDTTVCCPHSKVGVLFSGGIDSTILALLADKHVPKETPIDLFNVAFEKPTHGNESKCINWDVPDRITGTESLRELRELCPNREWNFVRINVTQAEKNENMKHISSLLYPLQLILDESIGTALSFASRGSGLIGDDTTKIFYQSPVRVLLLGSGADELFGGYARHRKVFSSSTSIDVGYRYLADELDMEWKRLPSRNLARDDRVISDNGVTSRTPYLEEDFVALARSLAVNQRCYHVAEGGVGDKLILRLVGYKLGLQRTAFNKKRAMQFGTHIADKKQKARDVSQFLAS